MLMQLGARRRPHRLRELHRRRGQHGRSHRDHQQPRRFRSIWRIATSTASSSASSTTRTSAASGRLGQLEVRRPRELRARRSAERREELHRDDLRPADAPSSTTPAAKALRTSRSRDSTPPRRAGEPARGGVQSAQQQAGRDGARVQRGIQAGNRLAALHQERRRQPRAHDGKPAVRAHDPAEQPHTAAGQCRRHDDGCGAAVDDLRTSSTPTPASTTCRSSTPAIWVSAAASSTGTTTATRPTTRRSPPAASRMDPYGVESAIRTPTARSRTTSTPGRWKRKRWRGYLQGSFVFDNSRAGQRACSVCAISTRNAVGGYNRVPQPRSSPRSRRRRRRAVTTTGCRRSICASTSPTSSSAA